MDFLQTYRAVFEKFQQNSFSYALIGGFALHFWGYPRMTNDLDFIILAIDKDKAHQCMEELGYKLWRSTENVAHYELEETYVDFIYSYKLHGKKLIERACEKDFFGLKLKVARAEDIIGLKVQSLVNNPLRWFKEMADIETLLVTNKGTLDLELVEEYFNLFHLENDWKLLRERLK